jgi:hypothetical protein
VTISDLAELHMLAWVTGSLCLYAYTVSAQLAAAIYGRSRLELR